MVVRISFSFLVCEEGANLVDGEIGSNFLEGMVVEIAVTVVSLLVGQSRFGAWVISFGRVLVSFVLLSQTRMLQGLAGYHIYLLGTIYKWTQFGSL